MKLKMKRLMWLLAITAMLCSPLCLGGWAKAGDDVPTSTPTYEERPTIKYSNGSETVTIARDEPSTGPIVLSGDDDNGYTLTLTDAKIENELTEPADGVSSTGLYIEGDVTISLSADNKIPYGVYCSGNLTIEGEGALTIDSLECKKELTVSGGSLIAGVEGVKADAITLHCGSVETDLLDFNTLYITCKNGAVIVSASSNEDGAKTVFTKNPTQPGITVYESDEMSIPAFIVSEPDDIWYYKYTDVEDYVAGSVFFCPGGDIPENSTVTFYDTYFSNAFWGTTPYHVTGCTSYEVKLSEYGDGDGYVYFTHEDVQFCPDFTRADVEDSLTLYFNMRS